MSISKCSVGLILLITLFQQRLIAQVTTPALIQTENIEVAGITTDAQIAALTTAQKLTTHQFFDGLGRPIQSIAVGASPNLNDIIAYAAYNNLGQQLTGYLPYMATPSTGNFHTAAPTEQLSFYANGLSDKVIDDPKPYMQKVVETSPLQRILNMGLAGNGFQPVTGDPTQHYKTVNSRSNNSSVYTNDADNTGVRIWTNNGTSSGVYATGSLMVMELTDEAGNVTASYKDANGRVVLSRQIITSQPIDGQTENCLDTYYIYDDAGELLYIVPPKALVAIRTANASPWSVALPAANILTFQFLYDALGRVIEKKDPGSDWAYIIYDPMNRPVLLQDGNLRNSNSWTYLKYDIRGRVVSHGIYIDAVNGTSCAAMQSYVSSLSAGYATYYYEEKQTGGTSPNFYTNRIFPTTNQNGSALQVLQYLYYDNYDFNDDGTADYTYQVQGLTNEATPVSLTRGLVTGNFTKTINNDGSLNVWLRSVPFYDKRDNLIQVGSNNHTNATATDTKTNVPDFIGKVLQTKIVKTVNAVAVTVLTSYGYDNANRISTIDQGNNGGTAIRVAAYFYNELGQLVWRKLHSTDQVNFFQNVDYRYNINGKLTSINNATLSVDNTTYTNNDANDLFGMNIMYDKPDAALGNSAVFNGNISAVEWKASSTGNSNERSYTYGYDQLSRMLTAHYIEWNSTSNNWTGSAGYNDENVTQYDINGNIETLTRTQNSSTTLIDNLNYIYNGNQLTTVTDATGNPAGFNPLSASNYTFDPLSGNLTVDPKKGATISYDVLNRTDKIVFTGSNNYIRYTYDANGGVLRKEVFTAGTLSNTYDYVDGFVYQNNVLSYFPTAEGRVRFSGPSTFTFEYFIRDHLGNVRVSFDGTGTTAVTKQENSYYPFGMALPGGVIPSTANQNLFNGGSEWQNVFASNMPDLYQSGYRNYDPELGRFIALDPLAIKANSMSPYQYAGNNPIGFNDPSGMLLRPPGETGPKLQGGGESDIDQTFDEIDQMNADYAAEADAAWWSRVGSMGLVHGATITLPSTGTYQDYSEFAGVITSVVGHLAATGQSTATFSDGFTNFDGAPDAWRIEYNYTDPNNGLPTVAVSSFNFGGISTLNYGQGGGIYINWSYNTNGLTSTSAAWKLYRNGTGAPAAIGNNVIKDLINSKEFQYHNNRIISGITPSKTGIFPVDLTSTDFFIGRTNVSYVIQINGDLATVLYSLFVNDGFWDPDFINERTLGKLGIKQYQPDGMGPNLEMGGHPYPFIPVTATETFPNPGYH